MSELESISVSKCEINFLPGTKDYRGKPMSEGREAAEQSATLTSFRVESSDELNLIVGLLEWPQANPEVKVIDLLAGLEKHNELEQRGRMSITPARDGNWLVVLSVLKYNVDKDRFTLHAGHLDQIDEYLGQSFEELLLAVGALRVGTRAEIDEETARTANQLAVVVTPGDIQTLAVTYTVTRALAVINDFGMDV